MTDSDKLIAEIKRVITEAEHIVVIQADNPDADSLASALALEAILEEQGKKISLYCGVDIPGYLHYLGGWARVSNEMPESFDASVIVDTASDKLLQKIGNAKKWLATKPLIIIDHHTTESDITLPATIYSTPAAATAEIIYELCARFEWQVPSDAKELIAVGILSDSLGLMSPNTSARTIHIIAELVESGVDLPKLESTRRESQRREPELIHYKGELLKRVEFHRDNRIATVTIPWNEIEKYSPLYNPPMLVLDDMRLARETVIAIAFKLYPDGKITAKIRGNYGYGIADKLAEHFGGGGHPLASGFKVTDGSSYDDIKKQTLDLADKLIKEVETANNNENL
jgi:phosphoesterase RecJ-like protein